METQIKKVSVPLFEAAKRVEELLDLISEGVDVEEFLTAELVAQMKTDLASAIDRRYFAKDSLEKQMTTLKETRDLLTTAIKVREKALESIQRTTTLALEQFKGVITEGQFCKVTLKRTPAALKHDVIVKSLSVSNAISSEQVLPDDIKPYVKTVTVQVLDTALLKEALAVESYTWARLESKNTCQFRHK